MAISNKEGSADKIESIESVLSRTEHYIEENQKSLTIIVGAIVVAVALYLAFNRYYLKPMEADAQSQMFVAEQYFGKDSFNIALNGTGTYPGFLTIIDDYKWSKSANLAHYYAGICYKNLGKYQDAIDYLKKFGSNDKILSNIALGSIGDCYAELGETDQAIKFYKRAAKNVKNDLTSPIYLMRAGILLEQKGDYEGALDVFQTIEKEYYGTTEGRQVEKYITRVKVKGNLK